MKNIIIYTDKKSSALAGFAAGAGTGAGDTGAADLGSSLVLFLLNKNIF